MATHFFHSGMVGAPTNTSAAGSTLEIIRACLATGFNLQTVQSASVASEVMTIAYAGAHGYEDKVWIRLDGAAGGSIVRRATVTGSNTLSILAPGFVDGAVAGALSTRVAPADWEEAFTDTNVGVFRSKVEGPGSTRFFYLVADTVSGQTPRMLRGFESMTDANTGFGPFPTVAQESGGGVIVRRYRFGDTPAWACVADGRTAYFCLATRCDATKLNAVFGFGDAAPFSSTDSFCAFVGADQEFPFASSAPAMYFPRGAGGSGAALGPLTFQPVLSMQGYPSPVDGGLVLFRDPYTTDPTLSNAIRCTGRGMLAPSALPVPSNSSAALVMPSVAGIAGRVVFFRTGEERVVRAMAFPIDEDWA